MGALTVIGVLFWIVGGYILIDVIFLIKSCKGQTMGTLVLFSTHNDYERGRIKNICYCPVYQYEVEGKTFTNEAKIYTRNPELYEIGSQKVVRYNLNNPDVCIIGNRNGKAGVAVILGIIGAILFIL